MAGLGAEKQPLRCACCGETDSREGFVRVALDHGNLKVGDTLRVECARRMGANVPATVSMIARVEPEPKPWDEKWKAVMVHGTVELHVGPEGGSCIQFGSVTDGDDEDLRRAQLASASPDLFQALEMAQLTMTAFADVLKTECKNWPLVREQIRAALRKARGEP